IPGTTTQANKHRSRAPESDSLGDRRECDLYDTHTATVGPMHKILMILATVVAAWIASAVPSRAAGASGCTYGPSGTTIDCGGEIPGSPGGLVTNPVGHSTGPVVPLVQMPSLTPGPGG